MALENIKQTLLNAVQNLFLLVNDSCSNVLSDNISYVLTEQYSLQHSIEEDDPDRILKMRGKKQINADEVAQFISRHYSELKVICLLVFKADAQNTLIEIRYCKNDKKGGISSKQYNPVWQCKLAIPPYGDQHHFDINWIHGAGGHKRKLWWFNWRKRLNLL